MRAWRRIYKTVTDEGRRFFSELDRPDQKQEAVLWDILQKNADTLYGRQHHFSSIKTIQDYRDNVCITTYEQLSDHIQRIGNGENNILTAEAVEVFEETGGVLKGQNGFPIPNHPCLRSRKHCTPGCIIYSHTVKRL